MSLDCSSLHYPPWCTRGQNTTDVISVPLSTLCQRHRRSIWHIAGDVHLDYSLRWSQPGFSILNYYFLTFLIYKYRTRIYFETMQISSFSSIFHLLILASIEDFCPKHFSLRWLPDGDFLIPSFLVQLALFCKEGLFLLPQLFIHSFVSIIMDRWWTRGSGTFPLTPSPLICGLQKHHRGERKTI